MDKLTAETGRECAGKNVECHGVVADFGREKWRHAVLSTFESMSNVFRSISSSKSRR